MKAVAYIEKSSKNKGISLIALTVTIIVIIILAGVSIAMLTQNNGVISNAKRAAITTEFSKYKEELGLFKTQELLNNRNFYDQSITAGKNVLNYNTKKDDGGNIKTVIPDLSDNYIDNFEIIKGELLFTSQDKFLLNIAKSLGIQINPYKIVDGRLLSSDNNLMLMDENGVLTIPETVTKIGEGAFSNVQGLKTIIIPYTVKEIEQSAFSNNTEIENVIFQTRTKEDGTIEGCETIGVDAFRSCSRLKEVKLPETLSNLEQEVFIYCVSLSEIKIPQNITKIKGWTFSGCVNLKKIILPQNLNVLCGSALENTKIEELDIPNSVTDITAFGKCEYLKNIDLNGNKLFSFNDGFLIDNKINRVLFITSDRLKSTDTLQIPEGVKIFGYGMEEYKNLKKLIIPKSLEDIPLSQSCAMPNSIESVIVQEGNSKFISEDGILYTKDTKKIVLCYSKETEIHIKEGILSAGPMSFEPAVNATTVIFPNSLEALESMVFTNAPNISNIVLGENVRDISSMFKYSNYGNVQISEKNKNYKVEDNVLYTKDGKKIVTILNKIKGKYEIKKGVETIGTMSFHSQNEMTDVKIPNTVTKIEQAFNYCNMEKIDIPSSVTEINKEAFSHSNIKSVNIEKKQNSISGSPWGLPIGERGIHWKN